MITGRSTGGPRIYQLSPSHDNLPIQEKTRVWKDEVLVQVYEAAICSLSWAAKCTQARFLQTSEVFWGDEAAMRSLSSAAKRKHAWSRKARSASSSLLPKR